MIALKVPQDLIDDWIEPLDNNETSRYAEVIFFFFVNSLR